MSVKNKVALVTGGACGIGYKYVEELLKNEAKCVVIADVSKANGEKAAETLEKTYGKGRVLFFLCDVTKEDQLKATFENVAKHFGHFDILVNNAGILDDGRWEFAVELNLVSLIRSTLLALEVMGKHNGGKGGTIVNISSIAGLMPTEHLPVYGATKHAVLAFTRSIALSTHEKTGVRFLVLCPGATDTTLMSPSEKHFLSIINKRNALEFFKSMPMQKTDVVAQALIDILEKGQNGRAYVSENSKPVYAVDFPHYSTRKLAL